MNDEEQEVWKPNDGPQTKALQSNAFETLYGGARGGGKTDAGIVWLLKEIRNPRLRALVIRRNSDDLSDWIDRATRLYTRYGVSRTSQPAVLKFPSGAIIRTGHLKDDQAYTKYQGHEYQRMLIEEVTQIPDETRYLQLLGSCRSTVVNLQARVFLTTNPGGVGHAWVKRRFVDMAVPGQKYNDGPSQRTRVFIPAKVEDTPQLTANDPGYIQFLEGLKETNVELWKAWRLGDWNTFAGQFFQEFRTDLHVVHPFIPNRQDVLVGGMDWGRSGKPTDQGAFYFSLDQVKKVWYNEIGFYRAKTIFELYGKEKTPKEWANIIKQRLRDFKLNVIDVDWIRGDPAMFTKGQDNSIAISDQFKENGITIKPASNDRIGGWENLHNWLSVAPDGKPYWQIASTCIHLIRTLPNLIHDEHKVEDVDTEGEDHPGDGERYKKKHLKWLDGRVGGALQDSRPLVKKMFTAKMDDGKQVGIDLDKFVPKQFR